MIGEKERYHGVALARLVQRAEQPITITSWNSVSRSSYVLNDRSALYIKYSTNRLSPWPFVFSADHWAELDDLSEVVEKIWIVLVCGQEGVISIDWGTVKTRLMHPDDTDGFSLLASKRPSQKFRLRGSGATPILIAENHYPDIILREIAGTATVPPS